VYHDLQNCANVLETAPGLCTVACLPISDIKVEEGSDIPDEQDPLAVTSPAVKDEQRVSNVYITCECYSSSDT
jgi:hypothetical protein